MSFTECSPFLADGGMDDGIGVGQRDEQQQQARERHNDGEDSNVGSIISNDCDIIRRDCFVSPATGIRVSPMYTHVRKKSSIVLPASAADDAGFGSGLVSVSGSASESTTGFDTDYRLVLQLR